VYIIALRAPRWAPVIAVRGFAAGVPDTTVGVTTMPLMTSDASAISGFSLNSNICGSAKDARGSPKSVCGIITKNNRANLREKNTIY